MSSAVALTRDELFEALWREADGDPTWYKNSALTLERILERGDGVAVYENEDLGHRELGKRQFVSYGSTDAQLEEPFFGAFRGPELVLVRSYLSQEAALAFSRYEDEFVVVVGPTDVPPDHLPDIGGNINWRYILVGYYREQKS